MTDYDLTTLAEVTGRIEEDVTPEMERVILKKITDASDLARFYGSPSWTADTAPPVVGRIVASAVAYFMSNPSGYAQSRAADETLIWQAGDSPGKISFSEVEIAQLQAAAAGLKAPSFGTMQMSANVPTRRRGHHVYDHHGGERYAISAGYGMPFPIGY